MPVLITNHLVLPAFRAGMIDCLWSSMINARITHKILTAFLADLTYLKWFGHMLPATVALFLLEYLGI